MWGAESNNLFIAVHGDQSNKADTIIEIFSEVAAAKGYQVLSFDLPEHGERKDGTYLCNAQNCVDDLTEIIKYVLTCSSNISVFGCSIGAYFSMLAYKDEYIQKSLFLSPVVDMKRVINNIMTWFDVSEESLEIEQKIITPVKMLYWDYYQYVFNNPVEWNKPTALLYGVKDNICEADYVIRFAERTKAKMTIFDDGEHFFHTEQQLEFMRKWLKDSIPRTEEIGKQ